MKQGRIVKVAVVAFVGALLAPTTAIAGRPINAVHFVAPGGEATFEHGFENFSAEYKVGYHKDHECMIHLIGHPYDTGGPSAFTLPQAFRPLQGVYVAIPIGGATQDGAAEVSPGGVVKLYNSGGGSALFGLDGVVFRAASC